MELCFHVYYHVHLMYEENVNVLESQMIMYYKRGGFLITKISSNSPQGKYKWWKAKDFKSEKNDLQKLVSPMLKHF